MDLPFSHDAFLDVCGAYNTRLWPAVVPLWVLTAAAAWRRRSAPHSQARPMFALLAVLFAWLALRPRSYPMATSAMWTSIASGVPRVVVILPLLWAVIGSSAAFTLGMYADLALVAAGALLTVDVLAPTALGRWSVPA